MQTVEITRGQDKGTHRVYTKTEADRDGLVYLDNWREGKAGGWILTDDGFVLEVLHCGPFGYDSLLRTAQGTYRCRNSDTLTTEPRQSRFKITGRGSPNFSDSRAHISSREKLFVELWCSLGDSVRAYRMAFGSDKITAQSVTDGIKRLLARKRVLTYMKAYLGDVLEKEGIDPKTVIKGVKEIANEKYDPKTGHNILPAKLKAWAMLGLLVDVDMSSRSGRPPGGILPPGEVTGEIEDVEFESIEEDISSPDQPLLEADASGGNSEKGV